MPKDPSVVLSAAKWKGVARVLIASDPTANARLDPVAESYREGTLAPVAEVIRVAQAVLRPDHRVLDVGAHLGGFALYAASVGCDVIAVEASSQNARLLEISAKANQFQRLQVVNAAVMDVPGTVQFSSHGPFGHIATSKTGMPSAEVAAITLDAMLEARGWDRIDFMKMDVEGSEIAALRGARRLLSRPDAPLLYIESNSHTLGFYDRSTLDLKTELAGFGYNLFEVGAAGALIPRAVQDQQTETVVDYVAAKQLPDTLRERTRRRYGHRSRFSRLANLIYRNPIVQAICSPFRPVR